MQGDVLVLLAWFAAVPPDERLLAAELLTRLVGSAVYDADVLDTRQFTEQATGPDLYGGPDLADLAETFEMNRAREVAGRASPVAAAREELAGLARDVAVGVPGLVRMAFPTGAGKTMSAARFAVHHAARWGHRRLIYAAPFLSITTQNAAVMRTLFGAGQVLEHHSGTDLDRWSEPEPGTGIRGGPIRCAAENWDMPVIVPRLAAYAPGRRSVASSPVGVKWMRTLPSSPIERSNWPVRLTGAGAVALAAGSVPARTASNQRRNSGMVPI